MTSTQEESKNETVIRCEIDPPNHEAIKEFDIRSLEPLRQSLFEEHAETFQRGAASSLFVDTPPAYSNHFYKELVNHMLDEGNEGIISSANIFNDFH